MESKFKIPISTVIGVVLVLGLLYTVGYAVYNVYLHPLRTYPGPKLTAATWVTYQVQRVRGNGITYITNLHKKYGPVVRIAPWELSYIDAQAWKDIYGHRIAGKGNLPKDPKWYNVAGNGTDQDILTANDATHSRARRVFSNAFSDRALREQEDLLCTYVDMLIGRLRRTVEKNPKEEINIVDMYNFTTFDIMGDLTFGEPLDLLKEGVYTPWVTAIHSFFKAGVYAQAFHDFPLIESFMQMFVPKSAMVEREKHLKFSFDRVDRRLARKTERPDIWGLVLRKEGTEKGLTLNEMHANANVFMTAGTETTATLLSGITYYLLQNPCIMEKLVTEIRTAFRSDKDITITSLAQLEYLSACLQEALRVYPPVPVGLFRRTPPEGAEICGRYVPGGTTVYLSPYAAFHSTYNFHLPDNYIPERWTNDQRYESDKRNVFEPFSYGPRNCIGKNLALHEMRLILTKVLFNFDLTLCKESNNWTDQNVYGLWFKNPLMVNLKPVQTLDSGA